jgi:GNAT superfamily N-acetyltransferase
MEIKDLTDETREPYLACLEEWSEDVKEGRDLKIRWVQAMQKKGLRVKCAVESGKVLGMIQYVPIEHAFAEGRDLYFVHCIWVHGHKNRGVGNVQGRGIGKALLAAAEKDAAGLGARGMAAWGLWLPFWMRASWFRKQGYRKADRDGMAVLLYKPFTADAEPPKWIRKKKRPTSAGDRVVVTALCNGWCTGQNTAFERARRACAEFPGKVEFIGVDTSDRAAFLEWGMPDALFVDGKSVRLGPPPPYEKIKKTIARRVAAQKPPGSADKSF